MTAGIVYRVPATRLAGWSGEPVIVRVDDVAGLATVCVDPPAGLVHLEMPLSPQTAGELAGWRGGAPIDFRLADPANDYPLLYACSPLVDYAPVRITIPVVEGFGRAVRLAVSLQLPVRLQIGQPGPEPIDELAEVLSRFLHGSTVAVPVEPFQGVLNALLRGEPFSLWAIAEDDPALFREVDALGEERLPVRLGGARLAASGEDQAGAVAARFAGDGECRACPFAKGCLGYFKWPDPGYSCAGIREVLDRLSAAADELRADLAAFDELAAGDR
ncbi:hypothetical protein [Accumulibacter sp.]|uniref:hypothetical protein n=1 Tax=Accumulibacter sp. TaxID=2053492 RepID=UPI0025D75A62|nr:hypothetical protein [Accumulibacter sp.]MCM8594889.1 hypothetical protein [Accumulibacter sp.]MCM8627831.1 hypothetical protein [Accumulibacter sp.]MDS4049035.1 hypothetical protein [Accumulibacter sp.]